jgi:hypothetical protein
VAEGLDKDNIEVVGPEELVQVVWANVPNPHEGKNSKHVDDADDSQAIAKTNEIDSQWEVNAKKKQSLNGETYIWKEPESEGDNANFCLDWADDCTHLGDMCCPGLICCDIQKLCIDPREKPQDKKSEEKLEGKSQELVEVGTEVEMEMDDVIYI